MNLYFLPLRVIARNNQLVRISTDSGWIGTPKYSDSTLVKPVISYTKDKEKEHSFLKM